MQRSVRRIATKIYGSSTYRGSKFRRAIVSVIFWVLINVSLTLASLFDAIKPAPTPAPDLLGLRPSKPKLQGDWQLLGYRVTI